MSLKQIAIPDSNSEFSRAVKSRLDSKYPAILPSYTYQELMAVEPGPYNGWVVVCSNGNAGAACLAYCNGRSWVIVALGNRISLT